MSPRRKLMVLALSIPSIAVLLVGGYPLGIAIREEGLIEDLENYDEVKSREAAEWLGRHGSSRAMKRLFDLARGLCRRAETDELSNGAKNSMICIGRALEQIATKRRREVVPILVKILRERPSYPPPDGNQIRIGAANCLRRIGPDAHEAVAALREASSEEDEEFRVYVVRAMRAIQAP